MRIVVMWGSVRLPSMRLTVFFPTPASAARSSWPEDEAESYRAESGGYPEAEGWKAVRLSPEDMRGLLEIHEAPRVAFPQELKDGGRWVHYYEAPYFLAMLEAAPMALDALQN